MNYFSLLKISKGNGGRIFLIFRLNNAQNWKESTLTCSSAMVIFVFYFKNVFRR